MNYYIFQLFLSLVLLFLSLLSRAREINLNFHPHHASADSSLKQATGNRNFIFIQKKKIKVEQDFEVQIFFTTRVNVLGRLNHELDKMDDRSADMKKFEAENRRIFRLNETIKYKVRGAALRRVVQAKGYYDWEKNTVYRNPRTGSRCVRN